MRPASSELTNDKKNKTEDYLGAKSLSQVPGKWEILTSGQILMKVRQISQMGIFPEYGMVNKIPSLITNLSADNSPLYIIIIVRRNYLLAGVMSTNTVNLSSRRSIVGN
jgi:hypothetical protein